jgi:GT2 family glycosyltransferase
MPQLAILGMHRSGTSLVARYCAQAGVSPGPPQDMLAAGQDNPEGFFEHRELVAINDALLSHAGHSWADPCVVERFTDTSLRSTAEALLARLGGDDGGQFLIKDPRLCLTAGAWSSLLDEPSTLYVFRPAFSVARSLAARNRFPLQLGLLLWEFYNRAALRVLSPESSLAVAYDALVDDDAALPGMLRWLLERGFQCTDPTPQGVLNPRLRHAGAEPDGASAAIMSAEQCLLEAQCRALCQGDAPGEVAPMAEEALSRLRDLAASLAPLATVIETDLARRGAESLCEERTRERDVSLATLEKLQQEHRSLAGAHDEERRLHGKAAETLRALESEHRELAGAHQREVSEHRALISEHSALIREHNDLQEQQRQLQDKADYLFLMLTEAFRGLLVFEHSLLGRLQRRLRGAYRLLTGRRGRNSRYEDVLEYAHVHFNEYALEKPQPPPRKIDMLGDVLRYVLRNPSGSVRSFSWARLRRAAQVFFGSSSADLAVWVNARFPNDDARRPAFDPASLDASLDTLEFDFPRVEEPQVSIIVPVYNDYRVTVNCLRAVRQHSDGIAYEVILADDSSTDRTASITERIGNLVVSRTPENLRFLRNCKLAAQRARGECLLFLNNDTEVTDGWLSALLEPLEDPSVGVVGPKLLFADRKLQEAGGIVWNDASAWNFGRADNPEHPAYNYRREVDYVSGACLLIRRTLWEQLGGFDERFAPAYYEDADLCFAARAAGWRVVYEPHSEVFHFEGVSNGTDLEAGVKQHQVTNQAYSSRSGDRCSSQSTFPTGSRSCWPGTAPGAGRGYW